MTEVLYKDESYRIIGACFEVYNQKGFGFTEPVYQECLAIEFAMQGIPFVAQPEIQLEYKGKQLNQYFKPDFICYGKIIVELKSVSNLIDAHKAQTLNYLNAIQFELALLVNFGQFPRLAYERIANNRKKSSSHSVSEEIESWGLKKI
jgi:GxxExxY protein